MAIAFESIFEFVFRIYTALMATSSLVLEWFNTEISAEIVELLGLPASTTNLDLVLGTLLPSMLLISLVSYIVSAIIPS